MDYMIKEIGMTQLSEVVDFAWSKAQINSQNSFPKFESYEDMYNIFKKAIEHKDNKVLAYYGDTGLDGVLSLIVDDKGKFIQANGGIFTRGNHSVAAEKFINYIRELYPDYEILFGYPVENLEAVGFLNKIGAELIEASLVMELDMFEFKCLEHDTPLVTTLSSEYYQQFAALHDECNPEVYWNSERILEKRDLWDIFVIIMDKKIVGSINIRQYKNNGEIFAVSIDRAYHGEGYETALLSQSMKVMLNKGVGSVLYFVEKGHTNEEIAALGCGFQVKDDYVLYKLS